MFRPLSHWRAINHHVGVHPRYFFCLIPAGLSAQFYFADLCPCFRCLDYPAYSIHLVCQVITYSIPFRAVFFFSVHFRYRYPRHPFHRLHPFLRPRSSPQLLPQARFMTRLRHRHQSALRAVSPCAPTRSSLGIVLCCPVHISRRAPGTRIDNRAATRGNVGLWILPQGGLVRLV